MRMSVILIFNYRYYLKEANDVTKAEKTVAELKKRSMTVSFAESCTGGLLAKMVTDVSGSSAVFECGVVSYSNRIKHSVLGVKNETLGKYTAVSEQTVKEMARGVKKLSGADICVSVSGTAGPGSDSSGTPVGVIWICVMYKDKVFTKKLMNSFDENVRENNRLSAAETVFDMILSILGSELK